MNIMFGYLSPIYLNYEVFGKGDFSKILEDFYEFLVRAEQRSFWDLSKLLTLEPLLVTKLFLYEGVTKYQAPLS